MNVGPIMSGLEERAAEAAAPPRRRVLFVAYAFPPAGGVSIQRVTKFIKYLPEFGWTSSVLTVANPSVPLLDDSLLGGLPPDLIVRRARTLEPGYAFKSSVAGGQGAAAPSLAGRVRSLLAHAARTVGNLVLQPDPQILWRPDALRVGAALLHAVQHDAIIATGPPFSSLLLGQALSRRSGVPLVLDFRDEWTISNAYWENKQQGKFGNWLQGRMQRGALAAASLVLGTTPSTAAELSRLAAAAGSGSRVDYIYNGFDPSDYPPREQHGPRVDYGHGTGNFRLAFVGTLWNLNPIAFATEGILRLAQRAPELAARLELVVAGRKTAQQDLILDRLAASPVKLTRLPFVAHKDAVRLMCDSDALLLVNADLPNTERIINAKSFEYMAARRPVFVVAPRGDLWDLLGGLPGTILCEPKDTAGIADGLAAAIARWQHGVSYDAEAWDLARFERRTLAGRLAGLLDETVTARGDHRP